MEAKTFDGPDCLDRDGTVRWHFGENRRICTTWMEREEPKSETRAYDKKAFGNKASLMDWIHPSMPNLKRLLYNLNYFKCYWKQIPCVDNCISIYKPDRNSLQVLGNSHFISGTTKPQCRSVGRCCNCRVPKLKRVSTSRAWGLSYLDWWLIDWLLTGWPIEWLLND